MKYYIYEFTSIFFIFYLIVKLIIFIKKSSKKQYFNLQGSHSEERIFSLNFNTNSKKLNCKLQFFSKINTFSTIKLYQYGKSRGGYIGNVGKCKTSYVIKEPYLIPGKLRRKRIISANKNFDFK